MTPPPPMSCSYPECTFSTPQNIPSYEFLLKSLELHVQTAHMVTQNTQAKVEKPRRPSITCNMSESDWTFFLHKWDRYKRQTQLKTNQLTDELWACLDGDLERLAFQDGLDSVPTDDLIEAIKKTCSDDPTPIGAHCCVASDEADRPRNNKSLQRKGQRRGEKL